MTPSSKAPLDDKKKLRDRKSQQALRDRRKNHVNHLEEKLLACERDHKPDTIHNLVTTINSLRHENEILKAQQDQIQSIVSNWSPISVSQAHHPSSSVASPYYNNTRPVYSPILGSSTGPNSCEQVSQSFLRTQLEGSSDTVQRAQFPSVGDSLDFPFLDLLDWDAGQHQGPESQSTALTEALPPGVLSEYPWQSLPLIQPFSNASGIESRRLDWLSRPDIIASCPSVPAALDLLYNTGHNFLANAIAKRSRKRAIDTERLGFGWLVYVYCKWLVSPSPETFAHIPKFLWPTQSQLTILHSNAIDLIIWPELRASVIHSLSLYQLDEVFEVMSRCLEVHWDPNKDPLEPGPEGTLVISPQFLKVITSEDGWTLTSEFVDRYPALSHGLPSTAICRTL